MALPGPVSKASSSPSRPIQVTLATPPMLSTAIGRSRQPGRQRAVIDGSQRRALPAGGAVGGAQVVDHVDADAAREQRRRRPAAPCTALARRRVQHGLAVEADDVDVGRLQALLRQELPDRGGVALGQLALDLRRGSRAAPSRSGRPRASPMARCSAALKACVIGNGQRRRPASGYPRPSVSISATSMPSIDVPLIRPIARIVLPMGAFLCMFPPIQRTPDPLETAPSHNGAHNAAMAKYKSEFLNTLDERGFIHQCSDFAGLDALAAKGEVVAYVGYDCTAPSLHIGNFLTIMMLHWLQQTGNKPIALMGGGTTRVGDPSGKDETRAILPVEEIEANKESMQARVRQVPEVRARQDRRHHGRQRRVADQAQLHRDAARRRPALLGQPHADHGLGASCGSSASRR